MNDITPKALAFTSTFYYFATQKGTAEKNKKSMQATAHDSARVHADFNSALNINRFEQSVCGLQPESFHCERSSMRIALRTIAAIP